MQMNAMFTGRALDQIIEITWITIALLQHSYAFISKPKFLIKLLKIEVNSDHKYNITEVS